MKPSAVLHMMGYGLVYGFLLAMLFIWISIAMVSASNIEESSVFGALLISVFPSLLFER